ncbi:HNH endonuclease family protein [Corynebacterium pseudopelargi]|uniref:HNH endonuclease family protein n=1 Tax=Corynebacterium pseudopelargi TaxID=2080757 RepID=UPI001FE862A6|nr:HNH endonuclease family protein [Corynebacterium pseudopelargi]
MAQERGWIPEQITTPVPAHGAVDQLIIRQPEATPPYDRDAFGQAWSDDVDVPGGHNGCDTRNDMLQRDLSNITFKPNTRNCVVTSGYLQDPYSGLGHQFLKGNRTSTEVQIDHVVALADAWQSGAWRWDADLRRNFANDPANLQATLAAENQNKKAKTADQWLPSDPAYACTYVQRQVDLKLHYQLSVTQEEHDAMARILNGCN